MTEPDDGHTPASGDRRSVAVARLQPLLAAAAALDLDDTAWSDLHRRASDAIGALVADGTLPGHLAVAPADPPVVVTRLLVAAWRHVTR